MKNLNPDFEKGARQGLVNMLGLKEGENVCIITDEKTIAETENAFADVARNITGEENVEVYILEKFGKRPLTKVPDVLEKAAEKADVTMFVAQALGQELESVRKPFMMAAAKSGARHGHCPGFTSEMMSQGMATDYNIVYGLSKALYDILTPEHRINITSEAGTNLIVDTLKHFPWIYSKPIEKGKMANFPDGEIFCYPSRVNGVAIIDGCVGDSLCEKYGNISQTPIVVSIMNSAATGIICPENKTLEDDLNNYIFNKDGKRDFLTRFVGEIALGTNLGIEEAIGNLLQDEKLGNASHAAFGDPLAGHGSKAGYGCKGHLDLLMMNPTVTTASGIIIMDNGRYTEKVMKNTLSQLPPGYKLSDDRLSLISPNN